MRPRKNQDADDEPMYEDHAIMVVNDEDLAYYIMLLTLDPPTDAIN